MKQVYQQLALIGVRRLVSRLDRRCWSPTYGCFDREYWHYKTLIEFPRADFQQSLWGLALLYKNNFSGNEFYGSAEVFEWLKAGLQFWRQMRNRDGSVNEWYFQEHSFCASAFTSAAVGETLLLLREDLDKYFFRQMLDALVHTHQSLVMHKNLKVANQMAAGLVLSDSLRRLSPDPFFQRECEVWKADFLGLQDSEGWFSEYGGADIGYSLLTLDLLAHLLQRMIDPDLMKAAELLLKFLVNFINPDGLIGGIYSSRSTNHCFPYGIERLASNGDVLALRCLLALRYAIRNHLVPMPLTVDDTYLAYFYINSYCLAACEAILPNEIETQTSVDNLPLQYYPNAGLLSWKTETYHAIINAKKGVWQLSDVNGQFRGDGGYVLIDVEGKSWSSQLNTASDVSVIEKTEGNACLITIEKGFSQLDTSLPLRRNVILFKLLTNTLLKLPSLAWRFGDFVKHIKVWGMKSQDFRLTRSWRLGERTIEIIDKIYLTGKKDIAALYKVGEGSGMHSPSSMMYSGTTLNLDRNYQLLGEAVELKKNRQVEMQMAIQCQKT